VSWVHARLSPFRRHRTVTATRRDIKQEIKERVYQVAFVFLLLFAAVVIYNDLAKALPGHLL